ncbi:hypothetical protein [Bacillus sp. BP-3]|uniref:hypothetical protein n=1 Tax=Bacillus sp. BP-3 TaxID=3022773 RepID=UPI00232F4FE6|nr:hypothetical protein [Bacillus sp. BP-3]MDC2863850.1 hypothetical protein [Bacillus sp. BP-3]
MKGYLSIHSKLIDLNIVSNEPQMTVEFSIHYENGQLIETSLVINGHPDPKEVFEEITKYFKGTLQYL